MASLLSRTYLQSQPKSWQNNITSSLLHPYSNAIAKGNPKKDSGFDLFVPQDVILREITLIDMNVRCPFIKMENLPLLYVFCSSTPIKYG